MYNDVSIESVRPISSVSSVAQPVSLVNHESQSEYQSAIDLSVRKSESQPVIQSDKSMVHSDFMSVTQSAILSVKPVQSAVIQQVSSLNSEFQPVPQSFEFISSATSEFQSVSQSDIQPVTQFSSSANQFDITSVSTVPILTVQVSTVPVSAVPVSIVPVTSLPPTWLRE